MEIKEIECYSGIDDLPPFVLDIFDKDKLSSDDFLGRAVINVKNSAYSESMYDSVIPKWHPLKISPTKLSQGDILVSFIILDGIYKGKIQNSLKDSVKFDDYQIEIQVLGLRNL